MVKKLEKQYLRGFFASYFESSWPSGAAIPQGEKTAEKESKGLGQAKTCTEELPLACQRKARGS